MCRFCPVLHQRYTGNSTFLALRLAAIRKRGIPHRELGSTELLAAKQCRGRKLIIPPLQSSPLAARSSRESARVVLSSTESRRSSRHVRNVNRRAAEETPTDSGILRIADTIAIAEEEINRYAREHAFRIFPERNNKNCRVHLQTVH